MVDETTNDSTPDPSSVPDDQSSSPLTQVAKPSPFTPAPAQTPAPIAPAPKVAKLPTGTGTKFGTPEPTGTVKTEEEKQKQAAYDQYANMAADALDLHHGDVKATKEFVASGGLAQEHKLAILAALDHPDALPARSHVTLNKDTLHAAVAGPDTVVGGTKKELEHPTTATGGENIKASLIESTGLPGVASIFTDKANPDASGISPLSRALAKNTNKPAVDLKAVLPDDNTAGTAMERGLLGGVSGLTSPENLALIASMEGAPAAAGRLASSLKNVASTGFTLQMAHDLYQTAPELKHAVDDGDFNKAAELLGHMIPTAVFTGEGLKHLYEGGIKPFTDPEFLNQARAAGAEKRGQKLEDARAERQASRVAEAKKGNVIDVKPIAAESANAPAGEPAQLPPAPPHVTFDSIGGTEVKAPEPATRPSELAPNREVMIQDQRRAGGQGEQTADLPALHPEEHAELEAQAGRPLTTAEAANFRNNQLITQTNQRMAATGEGTRDEITNAREPHRAELEGGASVSPNLESRKATFVSGENSVAIEKAGKKIGHIGYRVDGKDAEISDVRIDPEHRGQGYGVQLYEQAAQKAKAEGLKTLSSNLSGMTTPAAERIWNKLQNKGYAIEYIESEDSDTGKPYYEWNLKKPLTVAEPEGGATISPNLESRTAPDHEIQSEGPEWERTHNIIVDGKKVGSVMVKTDPTGHAQIAGSQVAPDMRGQGLAQSAYRTAIAEAQANGATRITSDSTNVSPDANRVWEKLRDKGLPVENITHPNGKPGYQIDFENPAEPPASLESVAKQAGVAFRGVQQGVGDKAIAIFQDPVSKTSFTVDANNWSPEKFQQSLSAARERMKTPEPQFEQALARRGEMPNQTVNLAPAYGATGKYVGGHIEHRLPGETPEERRAQYAANLGNTQGTALMPVPKNRMTTGGTEHDLGSHELAHSVQAALEGFPTEGSEVMSHLHPETHPFAAATTKIPFDKIPGAVVQANGNVGFSKTRMREVGPAIVRVLLAAGHVQQAAHGMSIDANAGLFSDNQAAHAVAAAIGFSPEDIPAFIAAQRAELAKQWTPEMLAVVKNAAATREEGLSKTLLHSASKVQDVIQKVKEAQNAETKNGDAGRTRPDIHSLGGKTQPGGESETAKTDLGGHDEKAVSPRAEARKVGDTSEKLVARYGTTDDPLKAGFILPDGRMVPLHIEHDSMLKTVHADKISDRGYSGPLRENFIKDENVVRTRYRVGKGGPELVFSVPKSGVNDEQVSRMRQAIGVMGRNGNAVMEVAEPRGASTQKEFVRPSDIEPMLREIGAHPEQAVSPKVESRKELAPNKALQASAQKYAKENGMAEIDHSPTVADEARAEEIARTYDAAEHAPNDPKVKAAYDAFKSETLAQFHHLRDDLGLKFEPQEEDPYHSESEMMDDIKKNNRLKVFTGSGTGPDHPLSEIAPGTGGQTYNTVFRWVHDAMGHAAGGHDFSENGEKSATETHAQMYSDLARPAMRTETEGQTSWYFHNPKIVAGKATPGEFAEQKAFLLPDVSPDWHKKAGDMAAKQDAGGINPRTGKSDTKGTGVELIPELREPLKNVPTADDFHNFYEQRKELYDEYPQLRVGWDNNSGEAGGHEINVGAVGPGAPAVAKKLDQIAAFDIEKGENIPTGGSGKTREFPDYPLEQRMKDLQTQADPEGGRKIAGFSIPKSSVFAPIDAETWDTIQTEGIHEEQDAPKRAQWVSAPLLISSQDAEGLKNQTTAALEKFNQFDIALKKEFGGNLIDLIDYDKGTVQLVKKAEPEGGASISPKLESRKAPEEQNSLALETPKAPAPKQLTGAAKGATTPLLKQPLTIEGTGDNGRTTLFDLAGALNKWSQEGLKPDKEIKNALDRSRAEMTYQLAQDIGDANWYKKDTKDAIKTLQDNGFPELEKPTNEKLFRTMWAITSYGVDPDINLTSAAEAWKQYKTTGKMPLMADEKTNWPGYSGIKGSITLLNKLLDDKGEQGAMDWLLSKHPVSEIRDQKLKTHTSGTVPGKASDERYGMFIFGPKAGAFALNLQGVSEHTTVDVWGARTIRRWTGTLTPENVTGAPVTPEEARNFHHVIETLGKEFGLDTADAQAVLWSFEHDLYAAHGVGEAAKSYKTAAEKYVQRKQEGGNEDYVREQSQLFGQRYGSPSKKTEGGGKNAPASGRAQSGKKGIDAQRLIAALGGLKKPADVSPEVAGEVYLRQAEREIAKKGEPKTPNDVSRKVAGEVYLKHAERQAALDRLKNSAK